MKRSAFLPKGNFILKIKLISMKSALYITGVTIGLLISSCQKKEKTSGKVMDQMDLRDQKADEMVRDTITNEEGKVLTMAFNNEKQTATLIWQGETIELKQDQMASGMKYSNSTYVLTEHHGELTLFEGENVVFSHKR